MLRKRGDKELFSKDLKIHHIKFNVVEIIKQMMNKKMKKVK